jgi:hypothetical protein
MPASADGIDHPGEFLGDCPQPSLQRHVVPEAEAEFMRLLADLLGAAQRAGTARQDVTVPEVKTLMVGCQAMQGYNAELADRVTELALDGLRSR